MSSAPSQSPVGVALTKCYFCLGDGDVLINTWPSPAAAARVEALHGRVVDARPCRECAAYMERGVILISIRDGEPPPRDGEAADPYRTGGWCVVVEDAVARFLDALCPPADRDRFVGLARRHRYLFLEDAVWDRVGLPRGPAAAEGA